MLEGFRAKAPMYVDSRNLPPAEEKLEWLALMQHYGVPTRLLDFTYSPYVALYFAIRNFNNWPPHERGETPLYIVGINAQAVGEVAQTKSQEADKKEEDDENRKNERQTAAPQLVSLNPDSFLTDRDEWRFERQGQHNALVKALSPHGTRREYFKSQGFVSVAETTMHNPRLSSQQGLFLLNGAESLSLEDSLFTMMNSCNNEWFKCFTVPINELPSVERKLFQMNIHELSLFPDLEGLAGFVKQRVRLHWDPET